MKKTSILFSFLFLSILSFAQTSTAVFLCSTADCGSGTTIISSAPTDASTTSYLVWYVNSPSAPINASIIPQPSATSGTANMGTVTISGAGPNYVISIPFTVDANQGKATISNIDFDLNLYTAASFPGSALSASHSINTSTPLPVEFISVDAVATANIVNVNWSTASELNNDFFNIEKSIDGLNWTTVGTAAGAGTSEEVIDYSFVDNSNTETQRTFYRIKQVDFDGNFDYSEIVAVNFNKTNSTVIYPNPAKGNDYITVGSLNEISSLDVRNIAGQSIQIAFDISSSRLDISTLESGVYYITVNNETLKFVK